MDCNWEEFAIFSGTLDKSVFQWSRSTFYEWLISLKTDPEGHGIPTVFLPDVAALLNGFLITSDV